jgi:hypothetical protein
MADPANQNAVAILIAIATGAVKRVNITVPEDVLVQIDRYAGEHGLTRSISWCTQPGNGPILIQGICRSWKAAAKATRLKLPPAIRSHHFALICVLKSNLMNLWKGPIMSRRTLMSLAASVIFGIGFIVTISTEASAYYRGVYRGGVYRGGVYRGGYYGVRPGVAVGAAVGAAAVGAAAAGAYYAPGYYAPRCGAYPYPPCY